MTKISSLQQNEIFLHDKKTKTKTVNRTVRRNLRNTIQSSNHLTKDKPNILVDSHKSSSHTLLFQHRFTSLIHISRDTTKKKGYQVNLFPFLAYRKGEKKELHALQRPGSVSRARATSPVGFGASFLFATFSLPLSLSRHASPFLLSISLSLLPPDIY